ncbi:MAG: cobalamin biosynthesis protein CobG [Paracoccus sp. (in: a-proteobacteria)]|nr:cobalamin biosynthesis protein CobG [Paracoccus sp. (in: a-proteobacteria)]
MSGRVKGWCPGALRPMESGDGFIIRVRPRQAALSGAEVAAIAEAARRFGAGLIDLTNRANLQIRGIAAQNVAPAQEMLAAAGLLDADAATEARRNILTAPDWQEGDDTARLSAELAARLEELPDLPAKFGFAIDAGPAPILTDAPADLRIERAAEGLILRADGREWGCLLPHEGEIDALIRLAHWFAEARLRGGDARGDDAATADEHNGALDHAKDQAPLSAEPNLIRASTAHPVPPAEQNAPRHRYAPQMPTPQWPDPQSRRPHSPDQQSPTPRSPNHRPPTRMARLDAALPDWAAPRLPALPPRPAIKPGPGALGLAFGQISADDLAAIGAAGLRVTPWRIILSDAPAPPALIRDPANPLLRVDACAGAPLCPQATVATHALARALAPHIKGRLHVSGCAKGCARARPAAVTLTGREGRFDLIQDGLASDPPSREKLTETVILHLFRDPNAPFL